MNQSRACSDSLMPGMGGLFDYMSRNSYPALLQELPGNKRQVLNMAIPVRSLPDALERIVYCAG
jgi:hypothetical protein